MSDDMDMVSPGLDSPQQQFYDISSSLADPPKRRSQGKQIYVEEVPADP